MLSLHKTPDSIKVCDIVKNGRKVGDVQWHPTINEKYKNKSLIITGKKAIKITTFLKNLSKMLMISKKIKFQNRKVVGHYVITPFTYKPKKVQIFRHKSNIDIYNGILQLINEIRNEKNFKNIKRSDLFEDTEFSSSYN